MDNAAIDTERAGLWKTMHKLEQMVHISKSLDKKLEDKANELDATDPAKAKAIRESALFYTRQRTTDLLTQMAVTVQGYLALDLVKKNNVELVKGVDRASTTTVSALRTAVTVAQAMTNQKLVLEQITALNTTTAGMIDSTGEMLRPRPARSTSRRRPRPSRSETLQRAFQNIYDTMDQIDAFKLQALGNMKQTVDTLGREVEKSKGYIARAEGVNQAKLEGDGLAVHPHREQMTTRAFRQSYRPRARPRMRQLDERDGAVREAARARTAAAQCRPDAPLRAGRRRDRRDQHADHRHRSRQPIGMFGFLAAVGLRSGSPRCSLSCLAANAAWPARGPAQRRDGAAVRFLPLPARARAPRPAQAEIDAISAVLPSLSQTLERVDTSIPMRRTRAA